MFVNFQIEPIESANGKHSLWRLCTHRRGVDSHEPSEDELRRESSKLTSKGAPVESETSLPPPARTPLPAPPTEVFVPARPS